MLNKYPLFVLWVVTILPGQVYAQENTSRATVDWFGYMAGDFRYFHDDALYDGQEDAYFSTVFKPQLFFESRNRNHQVHFMGFARLDQYDDKRTHADIRDLYWRFAQANWELSAGIKTIAWGKTESNHLTDIVNQYDLVEGKTQEHKLGQPLVQFVYAPQWVTLEILATTYSRDLRFPGLKGRLQPGLLIAEPTFEREDAQYLPDFAARATKSIGNLDVAISNFYGTSRLPVFRPSGGEFVPYYEEINQTGAEAQWLTGPFAWKGEFIHQISERQTIQAFTIGGEFNLYSRSGPEFKWMLEYTFDERGKEQISGINKDLFGGLNINLNDRQSTNVLIAGFYDLDYGTTVLRSQVERRFGDTWKLVVAYNSISNTDKEDFYHLIRNDSFLEVALFHHFAK